MKSHGLLSLRQRALAGAFFFLCAFALFTAAHVASLYLDDSGETITVGAVLGIGHPPGYPLHTLLAHMTTWLPLGGPAESINLLGALFGAACGSAVFIVLMGATEGLNATKALSAAGLAAALLCIGPNFWHNALGAKGSIYQLNNLLSVLLLGILATPGPLSLRRLRVFWLIFGLGIAHHYMSQLPLLAASGRLLWPHRKKAWGECWLAAPGIALYCYLPLRSAQGPDLNWGGVQNLSDFWFFFFRLQYASTELSRSAGTSAAQCVYAVKLLWAEGFAIIPLAAALGLIWGRHERTKQALAAGWLASLASVTFYLNLKPDHFDLMRPYLFPAYLCQSLLAGGAFIAVSLKASSRLFWVLCPMALALPLALGLKEWPSCDLSDYFYALDDARGLLSGLPRNALLLCEGDAVVFPLWYVQRVLGERRDVATVGLAVLPMAWVREDLARRWPDLRHPLIPGPLGAESVNRLTEAYLAMNPQRAAYASFNRFDDGVQGWTLVSAGNAFRCVLSFPSPPAATPAGRAACLKRLDVVSLRGFARRPMDGDTLKYLVGDMGVRYNALGVDAENSAAYAEASSFYETAGRVAPEDPNFPFNAGNALYELAAKSRPSTLSVKAR